MPRAQSSRAVARRGARPRPGLWWACVGAEGDLGGLGPAVGTVAGPDDLESAALIGLIDAVDRFEPERGVPFEGYASLRIRGAVLDEVRRVDELGRADRRRQRALVATGGEPRGVATVSLDELL